MSTSYTQTPFLMAESKTHRTNLEAATNGIVGNTNAIAASSSSSSGAVHMGSNIRRTIEALHSIHSQLQPKLDKARYKAEAGLSRRGYLRSTTATTVRSSAEGFPAVPAEELEEKEGLTEYSSRKGRSGWKDRYRDSGSAGRSAHEQPAKVDENEDPSSDDQNGLLRGRKAVNVDTHMHMRMPAVDAFLNAKQRHPRNVFDDSPELVGEDEDVNRLGKEMENSSLHRGWPPF